MFGYKKRNKNLRKLGFANYQEYLRSSLWKTIRAQKLKECPNCKLCGKPATQVHHQSYDIPTLQGKNLQKIYSVCKSCHYRVEFSYGQKKTFKQARKSFSSKKNWNNYMRAADLFIKEGQFEEYDNIVWGITRNSLKFD